MLTRRCARLDLVIVSRTKPIPSGLRWHVACLDGRLGGLAGVKLISLKGATQQETMVGHRET